MAAKSVTLCTLQGVDVIQSLDPADENLVSFVADADIDMDGANGESVDENNKPVFAYAPGDKGWDLLVNAGYPNGQYRDILLCDHAGNLLNVSGGYISRTAWQDKTKSWNDPTKWLDAASIPYFVVENFIRTRAKGVVLGCAGRISVIDPKTGKVIKSVDAICGDIGPLKKIGEISYAAAVALDIDPDPRTGGTSDLIVKYEFWPGKQFTFEGKTYDLIPFGS